MDTKAVGFLERLLRDGEMLDQDVVDPDRLTTTMMRFLGVAAVGVFAHGLVVGLVSASVVADGFAPGWYALGAPPIAVPVALTGAFLTATAVGLPSFYFYTRLAGVDVSFRIVTAQSLRALARTSVVLLAVLPFYAAVVLSSQLGVELGAGVIHWGLALPFFAGLFGIKSVFSSFRRMVVEEERTSGGLRIVTEHRRAGLLFLVVAWGALFTTVAPVALWRYGQFMASLFS